MKRQPAHSKTNYTSTPLFAFFILLFVFLIGAVVLSYPLISEWWNSNHQQETVKGYQEMIEHLDERDYSEYISAAHSYNQYLLSTGTILTDPFDFELLDEQAGEYRNMLNYTDVMAKIEIPEIDVELPIYHGTAEDTLAMGIGHLEGTSLPVGGVGSHCVLTGHTGLPGKKLFTDIIKLELDDVFYINVMNEQLVYQVENIEVIWPDEISKLVLEPDQDYVTLVTCTPYGVNDHRLLVRGKRIYPEELTPEEVTVIEQKTESKKGISTIEIIEMAGASTAFILFLIMLAMTISVVRQKRKQRYEKR